MRKVLLICLLLTGCSFFYSTDVEKIRNSKPSDKEEMILFQIEHFLNSDYDVIGYNITGTRYSPRVEITLREKDGGRDMFVEIKWN